VFSNSSNFLLIGYSFGSLLTLKLAQILESSGKSGKLLIIDGSPKFIHQISTQLVPKDHTEEDLQGLILLACIKILFRDSAQEVATKVFSHKDIKERVEAFLDVAKHRSEYSVNYGRQMLTGLFNRLRMSLDIDVNSFPSLQKSTLSFVKASESSLSEIDVDYGLKSYVNNNEIKIDTLNGDHVSILSNLQLIEIINNLKN
jgi:fatty acid synthase